MKSNAEIRLAELLEIIPSLLRELSEEEFSAKISATKWSKKEVIGHLIDSAANNHQRFIRLQYQQLPTLFYDQNKWNELNHYQDLPGAHIIQLWTIYNQHLLEVIKRIPEEHLSKECIVNDGKHQTLEFLRDDYVVHLEHHMRQVVSY
jgi:hypothetical protein